MGVAGELFLAGTGLTANEDWHLACCRSLDLTDNGSHGRVAGDEAGCRAPDLVLKMLRSRRQIFARVRRTRGLAAFKCGFRFLNVAIGSSSFNLIGHSSKGSVFKKRVGASSSMP